MDIFNGYIMDILTMLWLRWEDDGLDRMVLLWIY